MNRRQHLRELAKTAEQLGYVLEGRTRRQHLKWRNRHGVLVITSSEMPTDRHMRNSEGFLRRYADTRPKTILAETLKRA